MLPYTEAEKQAWLSNEKTLSLSFSDNTTVDYTSIISESMETTYSLCSDNELRWGKCNPTQFKISLTASNKNYKGLYVTPTLICGTYSQVIGTFLVVEDEKENDSTIHTLTCYDKLYEINKTDYAAWYNAINWSSITTIGAFRNAFFSHISLTQATEGTFYSDSISINKPIAECTSLTGETILNAILELEGCFGRILPDGRFKHEYIEVYADGIYPATDLYPGTALYPAEGNISRYFQGDIYMNSLSYSNYQTDKISHLIIRADADDIGGSASITSTTENTYIIQGNFLMTGQSSTVLDNMASWLLNRLKDYYLYPGSFDVQGRPWIEVGDSVFGQGLVDMVQFPILELTRKGINGLVDTYKAQHVKNYDETLTSVPSSVIELNGKTNKLIRTVEETRSLITDPETGLQSQINQLPGQIETVVASAQDTWNVFPYSITLYGYEVPTADNPKASDHTNEYYLNQSTGIIYRSNGSTWVYVKQCDSKIDEVQSEIDQLPNSIKLSVASSQEIWDESSYNISVRGYGTPSAMGLEPSDYTYGYYLDQETGQVYYSNGSYWTYVAQLTSIISDVYGELNVRIRTNDYGTVCSLIEGHADEIDFTANHMFTVSATNLSIDRSGNVEATNFIGDNCILKETTSFKDANDNLLGYVGKTTVESEDGFGMRNDSSGTGAALINPSTGVLWLKGEGRTLKLSSDGLEPWRATAFGTDIPLGSSSHAWSEVHTKKLDLYNDATSATDSHLGSAYKIYVKDGNTEYSLKAYIKGLINGTIT